MANNDEQNPFGAVQAPPAAIPVVSSGPFVVSTASPTASPKPRAMNAFYATVRKDLATRQAEKRQHGGDGF